jgi:ribosomal protein S18 acetylase RimI-like enzyme
MNYSLHDDTHPAGLAAVDNGLDEYNQAIGHTHEVRRLGVFATDGAGHIAGGAVGRTWGRCCELQQLWVDYPHRKHGIGRELMRQFEAEATRRGCGLCYLDTFDFQAPEFYRKIGYHTVLEIEGFGNGFRKYAMHKKLDAHHHERDGRNDTEASSAGVAIRMLTRFDAAVLEDVAPDVMAALLAHGRTLGCTEAWLGSERDNVAARRLYAAAGGKEEPMVYVTFRIEFTNRGNA